MDLKTIKYAQSNYGSDVYEVIGIPDGMTLGDFIKEVDRYHGGMHNASSIHVLAEKKNSFLSSKTLFKLDIPQHKKTIIDNLVEDWLDIPISCHQAIGSWGANMYCVYIYGKHTKLPEQIFKN